MAITQQEPINTNTEHLNQSERTRLPTITFRNLKSIVKGYRKPNAFLYSFMSVTDVRRLLTRLVGKSSKWVPTSCNAADGRRSRQQHTMRDPGWFHHQKSFPLFNSASAAYLHGRIYSLDVYDVLSRSELFLRWPFQELCKGHCLGVVMVLLLLFGGCYSQMHFEIRFFECEPLNLKSFYLTSSELVISQLLGKSAGACSAVITVYPESSIFLLPVCDTARTFTGVDLPGCPRKRRPWRHVFGRGVGRSEAAPSLAAVSDLGPVPRTPSHLWNENVIVYYFCRRLGANEVPSFCPMSWQYQVYSGEEMLYYIVCIELRPEIIPFSKVQMDGKMQ